MKKLLLVLATLVSTTVWAQALPAVPIIVANGSAGGSNVICGTKVSFLIPVSSETEQNPQVLLQHLTHAGAQKIQKCLLNADRGWSTYAIIATFQDGSADAYIFRGE